MWITVGCQTKLYKGEESGHTAKWHHDLLIAVEVSHCVVARWKETVGLSNGVRNRDVGCTSTDSSRGDNDNRNDNDRRAGWIQEGWETRRTREE